MVNLVTDQVPDKNKKAQQEGSSKKNQEKDKKNQDKGKKNQDKGEKSQDKGEKNQEQGSGQKTQDEAFFEIRKKIDSMRKRTAARNVKQFMEKLYDPNLVGEKYFYEQDEDSLPTGKIPTNIEGMEPFYSTVLYSNTLDPAHWKGALKPEYFVGTWNAKEPPSATDLLGGPNDRPLEQRNWIDHGLEIFHECIDIRNNEKTGYSLLARKAIKQDVWLGQYTGELLNRDKFIPKAKSIYLIDIGIGDYHHDPIVDPTDDMLSIKTRSKTYYGKSQDPDSDWKPQAICWLDAMNSGSFLRFAAHSCEPNAGVDVRQNDGEDRVIAAYAKRDIKIGEKITISYGKNWFNGDRYCMCGETNCQHPDPKLQK